MGRYATALAPFIVAAGLLPATPADAVAGLSAMSEPVVERDSWECSNQETLIRQDTPPSSLEASYEVQVRMVRAPAGKARFDWTTVASEPAYGQQQIRCAAYAMIPGGFYEWRMREVVAALPGVWSPVSAPEPFYDRPEPMKWKWVRLKDVPTGLRVSWRYAGNPGGAKVVRYRIRLKSRVPVGSVPPSFTCEQGRNRCTILGMIEGRRTYYLTIQAYNGHRWSLGGRFWVCAGRCG